jgi:hypothetical protein
MSVSLMVIVLPLRLRKRGLCPSPGRASDRCDRRGEGCRPVILDPADVHIHALFRRERQSFQHAGTLILHGLVVKVLMCGGIRISGRHLLN